MLYIYIILYNIYNIIYIYIYIYSSDRAVLRLGLQGGTRIAPEVPVRLHRARLRRLLALRHGGQEVEGEAHAFKIELVQKPAKKRSQNRLCCGGVCGRTSGTSFHQLPTCPPSVDLRQAAAFPSCSCRSRVTSPDPYMSTTKLLDLALHSKHASSDLKAARGP